MVPLRHGTEEKETRSRYSPQPYNLNNPYDLDRYSQMSLKQKEKNHKDLRSFKSFDQRSLDKLQEFNIRKYIEQMKENERERSIHDDLK